VSATPSPQSLAISLRKPMATPRTPRSTSDVEPKPLPALAAFEEGDFHALADPLSRDPQFNDRRLATRRKLLSIAQAALERLGADAAKSGGALELAVRTSLHNPTVFNHMKVKRMWAYICRGKKEKARIKKVLGADLGKDLDAAYRNAYFCVAIEDAALEVSLKIHPDAWFDGQNLIHRTTKEGFAVWLALLNSTPGYRLRLDKWKGEWICGQITSDWLREFFRYYKPGELGLAVERRWPAPAGARGAALDPSVPAQLVDELRALAPLYRYAAWSEESDFLFGQRT
jgi:hypothetical protein